MYSHAGAVDGGYHNYAPTFVDKGSDYSARYRGRVILHKTNTEFDPGTYIVGYTTTFSLVHTSVVSAETAVYVTDFETTTSNNGFGTYDWSTFSGSAKQIMVHQSGFLAIKLDEKSPLWISAEAGITVSSPSGSRSFNEPYIMIWKVA